MPLLLAGIDEAGYGPTLGPLCVGMSLFRVRDWESGQPAPDLWKLLARAVCKKPGDSRKRIPVADSKAIKLANDTKTRHPLIHLERGVLSFLRSLPSCADLPATDTALFESLSASLESHAWYGTRTVDLPVGSTAGELCIAASRLAAACESAGVELLDLRCHIVNESLFNQTVKETGSKAEATALAVGHHLRRIRTHHAGGGEPCDLRIVCDQLGGRTQYEGLLSRELPGSRVAPLGESEERSRYSLGENSIIQFMPEAESAHLPVALASMVAKLTRELAMMRFNRYWCGKVPELKPTAGYSTDARRWLTDMREILHPEERTALVRIAEARVATQDPGLKTQDARTFLDIGARAALRAAGDVEPNPMVGAVIVKVDRIIGIGHHRKFGHLHAEREALADCHRCGEDPRGSTLYVTLEPCGHHGKQPRCTDALIAAGISRVIAARPDPNPLSGGGAAILRQKGIPCEFTSASQLAIRISDPFTKRIATGLPWVIAKWAQTADGRLTPDPGEPRWISGELSRARVHRLRSRVDAVLTGMGTVIADDPLLTARRVPRVRRVARRVVLDSNLNLPVISNLARTARESPVLVVCGSAALSGPHGPQRKASLEAAGVVVASVAGDSRGIDMQAALQLLADQFNTSTVLLEAGPRLLASALRMRLVDQCVVYVGGVRDRDVAHAGAERAAPELADAGVFELVRSRVSGSDTELTYWRVRHPS